MTHLDTIVKELTATFGSKPVKTADIARKITDLGFNFHVYYGEIRARYSIGHGVMQMTKPVEAEVVVEDEAAAKQRIDSRFQVLDIMVRATASGKNRAMIVSGPAGIGKSHGVEKAVTETIGDFAHIKGYVRATGLYKQLYQNRNANQTIVFDDADSIFDNETSLNLLKAACDSSESRKISWLSNTAMETEEGETIPSSFEFRGNVIFITNYDFQHMIDKGNKLAPHLEAMKSRCHYIDIGIKNTQDYLIRIKQVVDAGMLDGIIDYTSQQTLLYYMNQNAEKLQEISLRMVKKLADLMRIDSKNWVQLAQATCLKN